MNKENRKRMVLAMNMLVNAVAVDDVNYIFTSDEIPAYSIDSNNVDDCYTQDKEYAHLMSRFLRIMTNAKENGCLCDDGVCSDD